MTFAAAQTAAPKKPPIFRHGRSNSTRSPVSRPAGQTCEGLGLPGHHTSGFVPRVRTAARRAYAYLSPNAARSRLRAVDLDNSQTYPTHMLSVLFCRVLSGSWQPSEGRACLRQRYRPVVCAITQDVEGETQYCCHAVANIA